MGLDQWLFANKNGRDKDDIELGYWRKVNELQGYFERNYDLENCDNKYMTEQEIVSIIYDLEFRFEEEFTPTSGFFYGNYPMDKEDRFYTLYTFQKALRLKQDGFDIWYTCWY